MRIAIPVNFLTTLTVLALAGPATAGSIPIRLTDLLDQAQIDSPLEAVEGAQSPADLEQALKRKTLFEQDFERFSAKQVHWGASAPCRVVKRPADQGGGKALLYTGGGGHKCHFVLPADPSTHYRIRRSIRTGEGLVDLRVLESRVKIRHPKHLNHPADVKRVKGGKFIKASNLLFIHRFPAASPVDDWRTDSLHVFTTPYTRALVLMIHDAHSAVGNTEQDARFDDLLVERLEPTAAQQLALIKHDDLAEGADPKLGIAKHGQFLPIRHTADVQPPHDENHDYRYGLFAPAPTRMTFPLTPPEGARLRFSYGLMKTTAPGDRVEFQVQVAAGDADPETVFDQTLEASPDGSQWYWHAAEVDLHKWAGQSIRLSLATRLLDGERGHAVWGSPMVERPRKAGDPPNVILIAIDTLRADRLSCYGHGRATSPHIDQLATDGVLFERAFANSNWTTPSFASMFTGLPASRHQVVHRASLIPAAQDTLAELLRAGGWTTQGIAYKTYLYNMGFEQGFDDWFNLPRIDVKADDNLEKALAWLKNNKDRRFFLFMHFNDPHQPFNQPAPWDRKYNKPRALARFGLRLPIIIGPIKGIPSCKPCNKGGKPVPAFRRLASDLYDGEVAYLDDRLGRFLDALREAGLYEDSLIAFVSDHGEIIYERGDFFGHGSHRLDDELVRVPLIIKPPAGSDFPAGREVAAQVRMHDLMPTLLELAGLPADDLDGSARSLVGLMKSDAAGGDRVAISENVKHHVLSVRHGQWLYLLDYKPRRENRERLYRGRPPAPRKRVKLAAAPEQLQRMRVRTMEFFLQNRSGHHLLVTGDSKRRRYRLTLRSSVPLRGFNQLLGLEAVKRKQRRTFVFEGTTDSPVLLYARMPERARGKLRIELTSAGGDRVALEKEISLAERPAYEPGTLPGLLKAERAGARVYQGPEQISRRRKTKLDPQRIEALRSLGYVQ